MRRITIEAMSFSLAAGSVRDWNLDFAKNFFKAQKSRPLGGFFITSIFHCYDVCRGLDPV